MQKEHCDLVVAKRLFCDSHLNPINLPQRSVHPKHFRLDRILFDNFCYGPTLLFNLKLARKCFPIPETLLFEDWWIGFNAILYGKPSYLNQYVVKYRQHARNTISGIEDRQLIDRIKKDFKRHFEYYRLFESVIENTERLEPEQKVFYKKLIHLNTLYRQLFFEKSLTARLAFLPLLYKNRALEPIFFLSLMIMLLGSRIYVIKKLNLYKKVFRSTD
jgi:hypothetical protein